MIHQFMQREVAAPTPTRQHGGAGALLQMGGRGTCILACHNDSGSLSQLPAMAMSHAHTPGTRAAQARVPALGLPAPPLSRGRPRRSRPCSHRSRTASPGQGHAPRRGHQCLTGSAPPEEVGAATVHGENG
jgi:hypothetical protein